jgi:hypothetical protein
VGAWTPSEEEIKEGIFFVRRVPSLKSKETPRRETKERQVKTTPADERPREADEGDEDLVAVFALRIENTPTKQIAAVMSNRRVYPTEGR